MTCPLCNYVMEPFDVECRRCHGKGVEKPAAPAEPPPPSAPPVPEKLWAVLQTPVPGTTAAPSSPPPNTPLPPGSTGEAPPYFLMVLEGGFHDPKLFRVYADAEALLFIYAGPYHFGMLDDIKRMRGQEGVMGNRMAGVTARAVAAGARSGVAGAGVGLIGAGIVGGLLWVGGKIAGSQIAKLAEVLDLLSLEGLREEAGAGKHCFWVGPGNTSQAKLRPANRGLMSFDEADVEGYAEFVHQSTGKWKLKLLTWADAAAAVQEFRRVLGADQVHVRFRF